MSKKNSNRKGAKPLPNDSHLECSDPNPGSSLPSQSSRSTDQGKLRSIWVVSAVVLALIGTGIFVAERWAAPSNRKASGSHPAYVARTKDTLTFNKDVAPIVFAKCAPCHRPSQSAPFAMLDYAEVKKHLHQIADVTARRYMPPWLPEPGYGEFADARLLSADELGILQQWIREGAPEGAASPPSLPQWRDNWQLGQPDLIVQLPEYHLASEGKDVYRNLVVPIPTSATQFVSGVEFLPGNPKLVHHAFVNVDETRKSRRLAAKQNPPGFDGMDLPDSAVMPGGQLLGWQPGKIPSRVGPGLAWVLKPKTDLVLQMHLHPSGKPETVAPRVGFYFTDQPPTTEPFRIRLVRFDFEIPPGATNYLVEQSYILPVDVEIPRVLAHCHYLGKNLQAYALLPDGEKRWLLWIKDWDFNWQGDYKYSSPISLPKGTKLVMHYFYDNSTNNARNPNSPPKTVGHGLQTTDEMAELTLQAVVHTPLDRSQLAEDYFRHFLRVSMDYYEYRLRRNPIDTEAHLKLGRAFSSLGQIGEALNHLNAALKIDPNDDRVHYELGFLYLQQRRLGDAYPEFREVIRLNPEDSEAFGNLGYILLATGRNQDAQKCFQAALRLNPDDSIARKNLALLQESR